MDYSTYMLGFPTLGPVEMVVIALVALLIFGSRLPQVGRSLGKGIVEFKKGLRGIQNEIDEVADIKDDIKSDITKEEQPPQGKSTT